MSTHGSRVGRIAYIRFVPHRPVADASLEMLRQGVHPAIPRGKALVAVGESGREVASAAAFVDWIAVVRLQNGVQPVRKREVNRLVEPREIVLALLLLALRPSALQANRADAQLRQIVFICGELREVAVEHFASDHPLVVLRVWRGARRKRADSREGRFVHNARPRKAACGDGDDSRRQSLNAQWSPHFPRHHLTSTVFSTPGPKKIGLPPPRTRLPSRTARPVNGTVKWNAAPRIDSQSLSRAISVCMGPHSPQ